MACSSPAATTSAGYIILRHLMSDIGGFFLDISHNITMCGTIPRAVVLGFSVYCKAVLITEIQAHNQFIPIISLGINSLCCLKQEYWQCPLVADFSAWKWFVKMFFKLLLPDLDVHLMSFRSKHAIMWQTSTSIGLMLTASGQCWSSSAA